MERKLSKRKMLRRKYKHYAAALAGAAILTGAGAAIPATTFAAENPANFHPIQQQTVATSHSNYGARYDTRNNNSTHYDTRYDARNNNNVSYHTRYDRDYSASYDSRDNNGSHFDTRYNNGSRFDTRFDRDGWHRHNHRHNYRFGWHRHNHSWPSPDDNRALYKDGQIYYSNR